MDHQQALSKAIELAKNPKVQIAAGLFLAFKSLTKLNAWYTKRVVNNHVHDPTWDWSREIVVVTGGSSGIGAVVVSRFANKGIKVLILDRNPPPTKLAANTYFYQADLADSETISSVADRIRAEHGNPTVLINNAGYANTNSILDVSEAGLKRIFNVNIIAPILLTKQFLPNMVKQNHGHIVNVASQASFATQATNVDYGATKSGVLSFHEGLAQELRHLYNAPRVRTSVVHPTWVSTPMIADLVAEGKLKDTPVTPEDVADRIVNQVLSGFGSQIIVPPSLGWTSMIRGLPGWLQESLRDTVTIILINANSNAKVRK
ncbi:retinal short-chain dehydrogenase reductase [Fusarium beomiforme]|uniref:Short-chain dehydrogenase/reductase 3 n=1 Tax=Fusarium beomiforme TaxID=44412 RepID=A0A9P5DVH0_9HYPO|nr:retinal short-chain dehydrogenase reductase [Fusarium beomiforme]